MNDTIIKDVIGLEMLDSRGNPTVFAKVTLAGGAFGTALAPSGASTGKYEAHELRDGDAARFFGKGVSKAVANINGPLKDHLKGRDASRIGEIDKLMRSLDGTANKSSIGANAILAVSIASAKAAAAASGRPLYAFLGNSGKFSLPKPMMNILNGGAHANNGLDIQEFMIVPIDASSMAESVRWCCETYATLKNVLAKRGLATSVGDEGGFAPNISSDKEALDLLIEAICGAGLKPGSEISIAIDAASSEWTDGGGSYTLPKAGRSFDSAGLASYWEELSSLYPVISIEDPLGEDDWTGFSAITERLGGRMMIVGDDLFVTNIERIDKGIHEGCGNAVLIKPNQIGTLSETISAVSLSKTAGYRTIMSHRSGDTEDAFIADLAVALGTEFIKTGAPCRAERTSKYNRLLYIEHELNV